MRAHVTQFPHERLEQGVSNGSFIPYNPDVLPSAVHCAEARKLTIDTEMNLGTGMGARIFGGAGGLAHVALGAIIIGSERGSSVVSQWLQEHEHGLEDLTATISDGSKRLFGIDAHMHSSVEHEGGAHHLASESTNGKNPDLDCAHSINIGSITEKAAEALQAGEAKKLSYKIADEADTLLSRGQLNYAARGMGYLSAILNRSTQTRITRDGIFSACAPFVDDIDPNDGMPPWKHITPLPAAAERRYMPLALVEGHKPSRRRARILMDYAGYETTADGHTYVNSLPIAAWLLPKVLPELGLDTDAIQASAHMVGVGSAIVLGVKNIDVIPQNQAIAA